MAKDRKPRDLLKDREKKGQLLGCDEISKEELSSML